MLIHDLWDAYRHDSVMLEYAGEPFPRIAALLGILGSMILLLICQMSDHKWVDDSHAGPDSGDMDMYCSRCGTTFHHILY